MPLSEEEKKKIEEEEKYRALVAAPATPQKQTYGLPALLSFFIPGLGQIIKGQVVKGIFVFIGFGIGLACFVIPGVFIWLTFPYRNFSKYEC